MPPQHQPQCPLLRRIMHHHPMPPIPLDHLHVRVPEAVVAPPRNQYPARCGSPDERLGGRTAAAMMRRLQPVDTRHFSVRQPGPFGSSFHIPRQQQALALRFDQQDTGTVITALPVHPAPQRKAHAIPIPLLATGTRLQRNINQRFPTDYPLDRQTTRNGHGPARMIGMCMADHHHVKAAHPQLAQGWQHHSLPQVAFPLAGPAS